MIFVARHYRDAEHAIRMSGIEFTRKPSIITTEGEEKRVFGLRLDPRDVVLVEAARGRGRSWYDGRYARQIEQYLESHGTPLNECNRFVLP